jgi:hypothetical protein
MLGRTSCCCQEVGDRVVFPGALEEIGGRVVFQGALEEIGDRVVFPGALASNLLSRHRKDTC